MFWEREVCIFVGKSWAVGFKTPLRLILFFWILGFGFDTLFQG